MIRFPDIRAEDRFLSSDGATLPAEFALGARAVTIEAAGNNRKKFSMLAYSGGALALKEYKHPVVVDLAGVTVPPPPIPILAEHAHEVGKADSITIGASGIQMTGYVDNETDDGKLIIAASKGGFPWEASIGASVQQMDELRAGEVITVNGQTFTGPLFVARKTTLKETSFVKRGADTARTSVAIAASIAAYNENHDELGRFSEGGGSGGGGSTGGGAKAPKEGDKIHVNGSPATVVSVLKDRSGNNTGYVVSQNGQQREVSGNIVHEHRVFVQQKAQEAAKPAPSSTARGPSSGDKVHVNGSPATVVSEIKDRSGKTTAYRVNQNGHEREVPASIVYEHRAARATAEGQANESPAAILFIAASQKGRSTMDEFNLWLKASGFEPETLTDPQRTQLKAAFDVEAAKKSPTPLATPPAPGADLAKLAETITANLRAENAAEQKRIAAINAKCAGFPDLAAKGIAENWTPDKAELEVLRASRPDAPVIHAGAGQQEISASACMEAALCISGGISETRVGKWFDEKVMNEAQGARFRGARISTLMFETIRAAGMHARLGAINDSTIRTALNAERKIRNMPPIQATGFTTMSMSGILSNVARKALIASYEAAGVVWPYFTAIRDHADFKIYTRYRLDASGALRKVGPDGELKHVTLNEANFTNQLDTYGAIIALTRQIMINDDLGAFLQLPQMFGRMARLAPEEAFFTLLLANTGSFFAAGNNNLITGAGGVITAANVLAAITLAETAFRNQVDSSGKPILTPPSRILTGTSNYTVALNAYEGRLKITGANQTEIGNNEHAGKYTPYSSPYVNNTAVRDENGVAFANQSSTKWWLFADPAVRAAVAMAFLNGNQIPTIENEDMQFDVLGMQWRCYLDFGVGFEDPTAAVQVNGA